MCINFNIAAFEEMRSTLDLLLRGAGVVAQPVELFKTTGRSASIRFCIAG